MEQKKEVNDSLGALVKSKAGRDSGKNFVVVGLIDHNFVFIADGDLRRLNRPKKKKRKHLVFSGIVFNSIAQKLRENKKVFDSEIYSAIKHAIEAEEDNRSLNA